jgi:hypothetical protein
MKIFSFEKVILFVLTTLSLSGFAQIPVFEWASNQQYVGMFQERCITTDSSENVIITGYFSGYHDFDPGPTDLLIQAVGAHDFYVVKLDPSGNLLWVKTFPSTANPGASNKAYSVVTDSSDNIYVSGSYYGPIDFDPGPGVHTLTPVTAVSLGFVFSLDSNGDFRWAHSLPLYGNTLSDNHDMAYGNDGSIILADRFSNTTDFDLGLGVFEVTPSSSNDLYVLKLDLDGNFVWVKTFEGYFQSYYALTTHDSGNIFLSGIFSSSVDLDPGPGVQSITSVGFTDGYIIKLTDLGDLVWAKTFSGVDDVEPTEIDVDGQQNVYVSGLFTGSPDFDPGIGTVPLTSAGNDDIFLLKLDQNGDFEWAHNYGGNGVDFKMSVCTDPGGNVYATGRYTDTLDFQPGAGTYNQIANPLSSSLFITKLNSNGILEWVKSFDGVSWNLGTSIHHAPTGSLYVAGEFDDVMDFNPGFGNAVYSSVGGRDGFNLKYSQCYQSTPIPDSSNLADLTGVCSIDSLVAPSATENCLGAIVGTPDVTLPITSIGTTVVTWTYDAGNGFIETQTQNVIIEDQQAPIPDLASLPNVTATCSVNSLSPPSATDNCSNSVTVTNDATFPILANTTMTWTYDDGNGNTSSQTQDVIITPIDNSVTLTNGVELEAVAIGYSYQWIDCDNGNASISGEINQQFIATANGNYAVEISNGTCTVTSDCIEISEASLLEDQIENLFSVYPNPTFDDVTFELNETNTLSHILIKDAAGRTVKFIDVDMDVFMYSINLEGKSGIYLVELVSMDQTTSKVRLLKL